MQKQNLLEEIIADSEQNMLGIAGHRTWILPSMFCYILLLMSVKYPVYTYLLTRSLCCPPLTFGKARLAAANCSAVAAASFTTISSCLSDEAGSRLPGRDDK